MKLTIAQTFSEIVEGWRLVYKQYVKSGLIKRNFFSIFTFPEYVNKNTAVLIGRSGKESICSVSAVLDSEHKLPLDNYFPDELEKLRNEKRKLIEIGLLANRTDKTSPLYILELMSGIARFGVFSNFHDYVIGVHPKRVKFFKRFFGFRQIGEQKNYDKLNGADVILLHADGKHFETLAQEASKAIYFEETEIKFNERFKFFSFTGIKLVKFMSFISRLFQKIKNSVIRLFSKK